MFGLSAFEIAIIALVIVLLFGTKKLPELGAGLGKAIHDFKKALAESSAPSSPSEKSDSEKKDDKGESGGGELQG